VKNKILGTLIGGFACAMLILGTGSNVSAGKKRIVFGGGPAGGTFQVVANAIQVYKPIKETADFSVKAQSSAGSIENLRKTNAGKQQMSVVYSGHVWLGREGKMKNDPKKYENVLAVAWLYGAPAQLVVRADSGIQSTSDLIGKKVGVGNAGSGAFANCELFFSHLGIWDKIERNAMGYNDAAAAFGNKQLDAFWLFTAFPSGAVIMAAQTNDIDLVNLGAEAEASGFFKDFPYFGKLTVPAGTYKGVDHDAPSFQDSALWVANKDVPADVVYDLLSMIYTDDGLAHMKEQKKTFKDMSLKTGASNIVTPFHPGAEKFWKEKGML
jgi:TRAP transporter TAXI family solute receptor